MNIKCAADLQLKKFNFSYSSIIIYSITIITVIAIKLFYSHADTSSLFFILKPISKIVEISTGISFSFDSEMGFLSSDSQVAIGSICAGINFLLILFCLLVFSFIKCFKSATQKVTAFFIFLFFSYIFAIIVNAFRVVVSMNISKYNDLYQLIDKDLFHKILGTFIYFFFLILCYLGFSKLFSKKVRDSHDNL